MRDTLQEEGFRDQREGETPGAFAARKELEFFEAVAVAGVFGGERALKAATRALSDSIDAHIYAKVVDPSYPLAPPSGTKGA